MQRGPVEQDWEPVILNGASQQKTKNTVSQIKPATNKNRSYFARRLQKIEEQAEDGNYKTETLDIDTKKAIMKARQAKGWSQKDLAVRCNMNQNTIRDYENGKLTPPGDHLNKISRILGIKLKAKRKKIIE